MSQRSSDSDGQTYDLDDYIEDLDEAATRVAMKEHQDLRAKNEDESEAYILKRLKD
jgi:hypothetical protein